MKYEFKGTKGNWIMPYNDAVETQDGLVCKDEQGNEWVHRSVYISDQNGNIITDVKQMTIGGWEKNHAKYAANARLICAAPDLLNELCKILQSIDGGGNVVTFGDHDINNIRTTIHKALNIN